MSRVAAAGSVTTARGLLPKLVVRFAIGYLIFAALLFSIGGFAFELFGAHTDWLSGYLEMYARLAGGALHVFARHRGHRQSHRRPLLTPDRA